MKPCFAYIRVSTVKQGDGVSLEAQREAIQRFAEGHDLTITQWFEEKETAAKRGRPVFEKMVGLLMRGKASGLIVHKIDRSARNFADWAKIGDLQDAGIDIHFANENLDFKSRGGRLTADIQAVIAADYVRNLREETIKGIDGRLKQGLYPFNAPTGYLDNGGGKPKTIDPVRGPLIRTLFGLYATGEYPLWSLVREMKSRGLTGRTGRPLSKTSIDHILRNPFYVGVIHIRRTGRSYPGAHEPLVTPALFTRVADVRAGRHVKKVTRHNHRFRGLFRCGLCQLALIGERQKGHVYYRCHSPACPTKTVREEMLQGVIGELLRAHSLSSAQVMALNERAVTSLGDETAKKAEEAIALEQAKLKERLSVLTDKLLDGVLDDATFSEKKMALLLEQRGLDEQKALVARAGDRLARFRKFLELAKNLHIAYEMAADAQKREFVKFATSNRIVRGKKIDIEPQKWLLTLQNAASFLGGAPASDTSRTQFQRILQDVSIPDGLVQFTTPPNEVDLWDALANSISSTKRSDGSINKTDRSLT